LAGGDCSVDEDGGEGAGRRVGWLASGIAVRWLGGVDGGAEDDDEDQEAEGGEEDEVTA